ncbi:MAG: class I SAM-dependent methyltransferase [Betaproteobacteria bacterium]|nr:class I SAM-dependent methyltransferase [Betaproteobacteria bacterium]
MEWWHPEELRKRACAIHEINDVSALDTGSGIGAYRRLFLQDSLEGTQIAHHNDVEPINKIRWLSKVLNLPRDGITTILDAGCGAGFTTGALAEHFHNANVTGIDLSEDAIGYASAKFPRASFQARAISPGQGTLGRFDIIFCFEFFPFTRNADPLVQAEFMRYFGDQLSQNGLIVIFQKWDNPTSLSAILGEVKQLCPGLVFEVHSSPHTRLPSWLPTPFAKFGSALISMTGREGMKRFVAVRKASP